MQIVQRRIETNIHGYREVSVAFRMARAAKLEARGVHLRTGRIRCPMLDASRTELVYGQKALPRTDKNGLTRWAKALGRRPATIKLVAYFSGPPYKALYNLIRGEFDEDAVNTGLIVRLKRGVNTNSLETGQFSQAAFDEFVWSIIPPLEGTTIDDGFLYSGLAATLYVEMSSIRRIMTHNVMTSPYKWRGLGRIMSRFEMQRLLIGVLGQKVKLDVTRPHRTTRALSLRDMHDFYKYGVFPVNIEENLAAAGLIELRSAIELP